MSPTDELGAETRKADVNLHRFISDDRWQRIHDNAARNDKGGEWFRGKIFLAHHCQFKENSMSTQDNANVVRRIFDEIYNQGNLAAVDEIFAAGYVDHSAPPGFPLGLDSFKRSFSMFRAAFPDIHVTVEDLIADGDKVVVRLTFRGTHTGALMGIPPTGKRVTITGIAIDRVEGGKVVEHWVNRDDLSMLQQLGVIPAM